MDELNTLIEKVKKVSLEFAEQSNNMMEECKMGEQQFKQFSDQIVKLSMAGHLFAMFFLTSKDLPKSYAELIRMIQTKKPGTNENLTYATEQVKKIKSNFMSELFNLFNELKPISRELSQSDPEMPLEVYVLYIGCYITLKELTMNPVKSYKEVEDFFGSKEFKRFVLLRTSN